VGSLIHSLPTSPATLATPQSAAVIAGCDRAWQDEEMRSLIHSLPTFPATLATSQSAAVIAGCDRILDDEEKRSLLDTQIAAVVSRLEASPRSVQVRDLGYRWGSCGHKGDLYFQWRVAMLPRTMIEYVVAHEWVHLIEPNHNHAFWIGSSKL
jgi:hypothetical protein